MMLVYNVWLDFRGHAENTMLCGRVDIDKLLVGFVNNTRKVITFCARLYSRPTTLFLRASNNIHIHIHMPIIRRLLLLLHSPICGQHWRCSLL